VKKTYSLSEERAATVDARFEQLADAVSRLGRNEWQLMFYGVVFTFLAAGILPPDAVNSFLWMALHGLQRFFMGSGGSLPPQLPPIA
jgi:hypothetical protein